MRDLTGLKRELGDGFSVARVLPQAHQRTVGPFVFFDYFGPVDFAPGKGIDVRPHPHIGLATVTYLFEGSQVHRDSLGNVQEIVPGDVNWMTAGRGIVHSERTGADIRARGHRMHGIQSWVGLPLAHEEDAPGFEHVAKDRLPMHNADGVRLRVVAGRAYRLASPVSAPMEIFYVDAQIAAGAMILFDKGERAEIKAVDNARVMLLGGAPLDGPRHVWWNFVSSSRERLERAKADWKAKRLGTIPGDAVEFIPLPD